MRVPHARAHVAFLQGLSQHLLLFSGSLRRSPCLTPSHNPLRKKRACHCQEECARPPRQALSCSRPRPQPQTSTHWTHQVISWGLKYLLGKYLAWLSDPTSQFKDVGLTNFSLYLTNHQDIPRPHPGDGP